MTHRWYSGDPLFRPAQGSYGSLPYALHTIRDKHVGIGNNEERWTSGMHCTAVYAWMTCLPGGARVGSSREGMETTMTLLGASMGWEAQTCNSINGQYTNQGYQPNNQRIGQRYSALKSALLTTSQEEHTVHWGGRSFGRSDESIPNRSACVAVRWSGKAEGWMWDLIRVDRTEEKDERRRLIEPRARGRVMLHEGYRGQISLLQP